MPTQGQQQRMMELYKKEKVNPMAGCLPIFIHDPGLLLALQARTSHGNEACAVFGSIRDFPARPTKIFNLFGLIPVDPICP